MTDSSNLHPQSFNDGIIEDFRAHDGKTTGPFADAPLVLITATGAKSGQPRTFPIVYTKDGDDLVIAASKQGADTNPDWYHNIVANPEVTVELPGDTYQATARAVPSGEERDRLFAAHSGAMPDFAKYQQQTERVIPVVVISKK